MVTNDYLNFRSYSDLKKYARQHNIFDSSIVSKFQRGYVPNLADDGFNEYYYLNKRYNGKTPLELAEERANYLAGIDELEKQGEIGSWRANIARKRLQKVIDKENRELDVLVNGYYTNLSNNPNEKKVNNINLNTSALFDVIETKTGNGQVLPVRFYKANLPANTYILNQRNKINQKDVEDRKKQSCVEAENVEVPTNRTYMISMISANNFMKDTISKGNISDDRKKQIIENYYRLPFLTISEHSQIQQLINQKNYDLRMAKKKIKKETWPFTDTRRERKARELQQIRTNYDRIEDDLRESFRQNREDMHKTIENLTQTDLENLQKAEISQISQKKLKSSKSKDKLPLVVRNIGEKILNRLGENQQKL
ncbi:MAG: hypothetical protein Ta2D_05940 [Rickettsiales bacterium]|nr:MAG: hypothetical protein Ta2D_05940 [Rickettsiales bacterium]